ncbi:BEL1-like homeodomain protein 7 [Senna tora]|uniref:peroxidase n=1 Tax=Senna tora TaxID=362788 RepID=A0A834TX89_9FABA|nr:BEL1-like homeodomain protein 7 [Senna tora]
MYPNQTFSSGSYADMLSGNPLLPHNYNEPVSVGGQNEVKFITTIGDPVTMHSIDGHSDTPGNSFTRTHLGLVDSEQNMQSQGLSLSLGTLMPPTVSVSVPPFQYHYPTTGFSSLMTTCLPNLKGTVSLKDDEASAECMASVSSGGFHNNIPKEVLYNPQSSVYQKELHSDPSLHGSQGFANAVLNSQYLKAAQELLDEIVNVRKALKQPGLEKQKSFRDIGLDGSKDTEEKSTSQSMQMSSDPNASSANTSCELSPAERQNLLDKKTKLLSMLDEVDKRYRQYCHQMQIVVSSFDMVAGCGAAEPYTALALRTISRHFRCLRDAISGQIQVTQRSLGEQEGIPRLRYVDQQLRQQKALQQLGVMRQAWRPQRGLPESSVSILRAWLFEHFLHPYPKDSEKIMLARQTGLTRNQVANWFINARVRLWKPMVEEMYKEEFGDSEMMSSNLSSEGTPKAVRDNVQMSDNRGEESQDNIKTTEFDATHGETVMHSGITKLQGDQRPNMNNTFYSSGPIPTNHNGDACLMPSAPASYDLSELGSFPVGGHVSLALELRNCETNEFAMPDNKRRNQTLDPSPENDLIDYHFTDSGKQQNRRSNTFPETLAAFPSIQAPVLADNSEMSHTRHLMDLLGASNGSNHQPQPQGLSLSLGSHMLVHSEDYRHQPPSLNQDQGLLTPNYFMSGQESREASNQGLDHLPSDYSFTTTTTFASPSTSLNQSLSTSYASVIGNSRYLRPVQCLLEELVDVGGNVVDRINEKYVEKLSRGSKTGARRLSSELRAELCNHGALLADKHELQVKIAKLISLLDEVEGRYETYYHQMEEVMSSFEMIAGVGAAKCYTALALQAMSRHFCSLRDAIVSQINMEKRKLLQDLPKISTDLSQLSLFDRDRRHNRMSLQHLGLIQSQRQVSNWFINARVRLWKPMIEEMYKDEFGDSSEDSLAREDTTDRVDPNLRGVAVSEAHPGFNFGWGSGHYLYPEFYQFSCPQLNEIVMSVLEEAIARDPRMPASLLRLHFHDCFVQGCDASILLDDSATIVSEKNSGPNKNSSGGPWWELPLGRRDSKTASLSGSNTHIPPPNATIANLITFFRRQGLDQVDLVALSGGHTIGVARCATFKQRLYNQKGQNQPDQTLEKSFYFGLKTVCPASGGDNNISPLDFGSPTRFDNTYFKLILSGKGLLNSDEVLLTGGVGDTQQLVKAFAEDETLFFHQFANSMIKMANISPLLGYHGEVRKNCRRVNH